MPTNNHSRSRNGNRRRDAQNNNPKGGNQYSGLIGTARNNPLATAAAVGGAVAAGVFLWSRRSQISDQMDNLAGQISQWRDSIAEGVGLQAQGIGADRSDSGNSDLRAATRSQMEIAEEALTLKETGQNL